MRTFKIFAIVAIATMCVCCGKKTKQEPVVQQPEKVAYKPIHHAITVGIETAETYAYFRAANEVPAKSVQVNYGEPYSPIVIKYTYSNGDTYTYTLKDFGLWENEAGKLRVMTDKEHTVWLQGQTKNGKFHEFVFFGNPKFNGRKITPNSYRGEIKYR